MFLISSYGAPLAQRASYLAQLSSLVGPDGAVNYDYIVTNSINSLLIGSECIPNGAYTNNLISLHLGFVKHMCMYFCWVKVLLSHLWLVCTNCGRLCCICTSVVLINYNYKALWHCDFVN